MARIEEDREDLYEEFRSAKLKWEIQLTNDVAPVTVGIRKDERFSCYFGADPCYHFSAEHQLLRAFYNGALYRTQGETLAKLIRKRTDQETILSRVDLNESELEAFIQKMKAKLKKLVTILEEESFKILRTNSDSENFDLIISRLLSIIDSEKPLAPAFPTKKK